MRFFPDIAAKRAELAPDGVAFIDDETGRAVRFAQLDAAVGRLAGALKARGIGPGDRVAVLSLNRPEIFQLLFAVGRLDAVLVPLNWRQPAPELAPVLADCAPRLLLHDAELTGLAAPLGAAVEEPIVSLDELAASGAPPVPPEVQADDRVWYLLYTSGTTGKPKAVIQTPAMAWANLVSMGNAIDMASTDRTLCFLPLFHTAGINLFALPTLMLGGCVRTLRRFDPGRVLQLLHNGDVTTFFGVPTVYQALAEHPGFDAADLGQVRAWGCGGATLPGPLLERWLARGIPVRSGFGMTETGPTVFLMDAASVARKRGSVGQPRLLSEARIVDARGRACPPGVAGELQIRGPGLTPGYWNNPEATATAYAEGGWLRTGDVARRDEDGYVFILDRLKDMFISGGENVFPAEVEAVLVRHPEIAEAAVIGVADRNWGEVGCAFLVLRPGATGDLEAIRLYCRERLAAYKVPKHFRLVSELPRTAAGKVVKPLLRQVFQP